jgi:hypothetical protein
MRTLLLASLALVAPLSRAQDVSQKVTFSAPAARASVLLKRLGEQTGIPLETSPQTKDEVLLLRVKDVPLKEILDRIAQVADADWKPEGGGFRLTRPSEKANAAARAELDERMASIERGLRGALERQAKLPAWTDAEAERLAENHRAQREAIGRGEGAVRLPATSAASAESAPGTRVLVSLVGAIGAKALATIGPNERRVYALNPTRMQRALPANSARLLQTFVQQQKQYADAYGKRQNDNDGSVMIISSMGGPEMGSGDPSLGIGQALLIFTRNGERLRVSMTVADTRGESIANSSWTVPISGGVPTKVGDEPVIELSPVGAEFAKLVGSTVNGGPIGTRQMVVRMITTEGGPTVSFDSTNSEPPVPISEELRTRLLRPEEYDPQTLIVGEALSKAAEQTGKNLIASLPDSAIIPLARRFATEKVTAPTLLGSMGFAAGLRVTPSDAWIQVAPRYPVTARYERIDRPALGRLARILQDRGFARLNDLAALAVAQAKPVSPADFDGNALRLINAGAAQSAVATLGDVNTLRLYASLTPAQQSILANGGSIPFAQLTGPQRSAIANDVFMSSDGPMIGEGPSGRVGPAVAVARFGIFGNVKSERTQILPEGVPANAAISLKTERQPVAFGTNSKTGASGIVTSNGLASARLAEERPDLRFLGSPIQYDRFQPAEQSQYTFRYDLAPNVSVTRGLSDAWIDVKANRVAFDGLPREFRDRTLAQLESLRKGMANVVVSPAAPARPANIPPAP